MTRTPNPHTPPTPHIPPSGPNTGGNGPQIDPTGLRYDRGDIDEQPTTTGLPANRDGWAVTGRGITVRTKACCGAVLVKERCDCRKVRRQIRKAPVIVMPAFNLRALREQHRTAADLERGVA
ncbi:hypothetical protein OHB44_27865 [Micromonospora sp. NBC_00821]|uniref:hypothetical protein n=1 Tax=Micromonospora sp. NBC_00821 TaxID=2975977 RepID=UPI002ED08157|nr:hypothetical protein OHB44_27865 [Micromonospora sp. NBC_00821]